VLRIPFLLATCAVVGILAGCGGSDATPTATTPPPPTTTAEPQGTIVAVSEKEFAITGVSATMTAGRYTFQVANDGTVPHNLTITGGAVGHTASASVVGGTSGHITVDLAPGTYAFYCSIGNHRSRGMEVAVTVS
jgi:plastocyanin